MPDKAPDQVFQQQPQANLNSMSQEMGFDIPVESVSLPSKGKLYPLEHPLCGEESVDIRCMTAREEDLLSSRALIKKGTALTKLIEACVLNKLVRADDLLVGDRNALLVAIRVTGYGSEYSVKITCPSCSEEFENTFTLNKLSIKELGTESVEEGANLFSFVLPLSKMLVYFRLLTGRDEDSISTAVSRLKKKTGSQVENGVTMRLLQSIVAIGDERDPGKLAKIIQNLRAGDARALRKHITNIAPNIDMKQHISCAECGEESEVTIPLGISFFWPDFDG